MKKTILVSLLFLLTSFFPVKCMPRQNSEEKKLCKIIKKVGVFSKDLIGIMFLDRAKLGLKDLKFSLGFEQPANEQERRAFEARRARRAFASISSFTVSSVPIIFDEVYRFNNEQAPVANQEPEEPCSP